MNKTENNPMLKVPTTLINELSKLGMDDMFDVRSIFLNSPKTLILLEAKNKSISLNRFAIRSLNSSVLSKEILCPCSLINGINMEMIPRMTNKNIIIVKTTAIIFGNLSFLTKRSTIGRPISDNMMAITK